MAQRAEVRLSDDLNGAEIPPGNGETVVFSVDGTSCEIDLTAENVSVLRKALRPYLEAGGPLEGSRRCPLRTKIGADTRTVMQCSGLAPTAIRYVTDGRVPNAVLAAFDAAWARVRAHCGR